MEKILREDGIAIFGGKDDVANFKRFIGRHFETVRPISFYFCFVLFCLLLLLLLAFLFVCLFCFIFCFVLFCFLGTLPVILISMQNCSEK